MKPTRNQLRDLLRILQATEPSEVDCEELVTRVGKLLETLERGERPPPELNAVSQHLDVCPQCREEYDALLRLYAPDRQG